MALTIFKQLPPYKRSHTQAAGKNLLGSGRSFQVLVVQKSRSAGLYPRMQFDSSRERGH